MNLIRLVSLSLFFCSYLIACEQNDKITKPSPTKLQPESSQASLPDSVNTQATSENPMKAKFQYRGTVRYVNVEGGFVGIVTDSGQKFLPFKLDPEIALDGAIIEFNGKRIKGMMTIQQWGTPFEVTSVNLIKPGSSDSSPLKPAN